MTETRIIFDVATKPFPWVPIWSSLGLLVLGCIAVVLKKLGWRRSPRILGFIAIAFSLAATAYYFGDWTITRHEEVRALATGHYEVLQGRVEDFHPMPDDGSSRESFTISGRTFSYSDEDPAEITPCFNQTVPHEGPIHAGMILRVTFASQCILRIEELPVNPSARHN